MAQGSSLCQVRGGSRCCSRSGRAGGAHRGLMADVDGPGPDRFHGRVHVDNLPIWYVHRSLPAAAAGPVDEEPRRHGGPPVLRGERTRSLEPNRIAESLKAVAWGWVRPFLHRFGCTRLPRLRRVERKGIAPVANSMTSQKPFSSVRLPLGLNGEVLAPNNLPSTRPKALGLEERREFWPPSKSGCSPWREPVPDTVSPSTSSYCGRGR